MHDLQRLQVGKFNISDSLTLEEIEKENINSKIITIEQLFKENDSIELSDKKLALFINGVQITRKEIDGIYKIYNNHKFIGIGVIKNNLLKRDIVI